MQWSRSRHRRGKLHCIVKTHARTSAAQRDNPNRTPGYVAVAVDCDRGTFVRELNTGLGTDRVENMKGFAVELLKLLKEAILGEANFDQCLQPGSPSRLGDG